jgi:hypothetical protein
VWEPGFPSPSEPLNQGDLISGLLFPKLALPLSTLSIRQAPVGMIECFERPGIIVTQCCVLDKSQTDHVSIAPVRPEGGLKSHQVAALMADNPPEDDLNEAEGEAVYTYDAFRLEPTGDLKRDAHDRLTIADLKQITSFCGDWEELKRRRTAKMTPVGRRNLRIKLARYFGRSTDEDRDALANLGLLPGTPSFPPSHGHSDPS